MVGHWGAILVGAGIGLVVAWSATIAVLLMALVGVVWGTWRKPVMILLAIPFILVVPWLHFSAIPGASSLSLSDLGLGVAVLVGWLRFGPQTPRRILRLDGAVFAFYLACLASVPYSLNLGASLRGMLQLSLAVGVYLLYSRIEQASEYRAFFYSMGILVGVCTLVGIAQFYANDPLFMGAYLNEVQQQERVTFGETVSKSVALFGHGNSFALLLSIVLPLFVGAAGSGVSSLVTVPVLALGGVGDLTTFSRGGWLALAIGYLSVLGFRWRGLRIRPGVTTFMLVLGVAAIGLVNQLGLFQLAIDRFTSEAFSERDLGSNLTRLVNLQAGWSAFLSRPLMGIGIGTSAVAYVQFGGFTDLGPHNLYLLVASERGVLAMGALVVLIGFTYADAWRLIRRTGDAVALGGLASWTALLVNGFFESVFVDVFLYFAFMALGLVASRLRSAQVRVHAIA